MGEELRVGWFELTLSNLFNQGDLNQIESYVELPWFNREDFQANFLDEFK